MDERGDSARASRIPAFLAHLEGARAPAVGEQAARYEATAVEHLPLHEAARRILQAAGVPLHVRDLGARIKAAGWRHPRVSNARPDLIEFQLAARLPRYPTFRRVAPNTFGLAGWEDEPVRRSKPRLQTVRGRGPRLAERIGEEPELVFGDEPTWRSS